MGRQQRRSRSQYVKQSAFRLWTDRSVDKASSTEDQSTSATATGDGEQRTSQAAGTDEQTENADTEQRARGG